MRTPADHAPAEPRADLSQRLDGARDLYLLALALGERHDGFEPFGRMIREARIHFERVIEQARAAGLDTSAIATVLGKENVELADSIRPDLRSRVGDLLAQAAHNRTQR
ncbi:MAG: hypothetical protein ACT4P6_03620 [Gemmatimonadaceae bacterium]